MFLISSFSSFFRLSFWNRLHFRIDLSFKSVFMDCAHPSPLLLIPSVSSKKEQLPSCFPAYQPVSSSDHPSNLVPTGGWSVCAESNNLTCSIFFSSFSHKHPCLQKSSMCPEAVERGLAAGRAPSPGRCCGDGSGNWDIVGWD